MPLIQNPATCPRAGCDAMGLYNINPIAISILQLKLPNGSYFVPGSGDFSDCASPTAPCSHRFENPASFKDHQGVGNVDYVINSKNTFSGHYVYEADPINANFPAVNALEPGNAVPGNTVSTQKTNQDVVAKLTTIVSNNAVNEFHVGYQRNVTVNSEAVLFHNSQLGIQDFVSPFTPGAAVDNMSYMNIGPGGTRWTSAYILSSVPTPISTNLSWVTRFPSPTASTHFEWASTLSVFRVLPSRGPDRWDSRRSRRSPTS